MTTAITQTATIIGIDAHIIQVEADISIGLGAFTIVGLPDGAIKESKDRITSAINNSIEEFPVRKLVVNLAPADVKKMGTGFDLPITMAILEATRFIPYSSLRDCLIIGELSLDGTVRPINGILAVALAAKKAGIKTLFLPEENARSASMVEGMEVFIAPNIPRLIDHFTGIESLHPYSDKEESPPPALTTHLDFLDVKGQAMAKRALEIAAAGNHNVLFTGPPGSGKSMLAKRMAGILPPLSFEESLEVTKIHSIAGMMSNDQNVILDRPFRDPHHSISGAGLVGGGSYPRPGEISLAHRGVLFLDELPEFPRIVLDLLRQPMEEKKVTISRARMAIVFPADYILLAAMNPCPCGYLGDPGKECVCSASSIIKYRGRVSGPLLDRIDLQIEMPTLSYEEMNAKPSGESSHVIQTRVTRAREAQKKRFIRTETKTNSHMSHREIETHCALDTVGHQILSSALNRFHLSGRGHDSILKIARTIADLDHSPIVTPHHLTEAITYRGMDKELNF